MRESVPGPAPATYRIQTLGCKTNLYDSRKLADALEMLGLREAGSEEEPDVCIVNTCTVTHTADRKSRKIAARMARRYPQALVYVTGCYAAIAPEDLREVAGVGRVVPRERWPEMLAELAGGDLPPEIGHMTGDFGINTFGGRARAFLKIQDGCDSYCAYCIIPYTRGRPRSRELEGVVDEARRLIDQGFREIVLTGIHLGFYGRELKPRLSLADAVRAIAELPGLGRLRISSLEGLEVDRELLDAMQHPAVCPHLHIPLQSGDPNVLERMDRRYTPRQFYSVVAAVREALDEPAITTDIIAGFPGETEREFLNTLEFVGRVRFSRLHVFPFSAREGTPAAEMEGQIDPRVTKRRVTTLTELGDELATQWAERFVGGDVRVLFERRDHEGILHGYTDRYVPLRMPGGEDHVEKVETVRATRTECNELVAEAPEEGENAR